MDLDIFKGSGFFLLNGFFYSYSLFFHLDISQKGPKVILFETYQGQWGHHYSFMSFAGV